jgi:branched-chain amino acid transport system substrate-binding protein
MKLRFALLVAGALLACGPGRAVHAAEKIKIGFLSTLSGNGAALGIEIRDGFNLALKHADGKFGGLPTEVIAVDDQQNPEAGKQAAERLLKRDKVDIMTGVVYSNVMYAIAPAVIQNETFYISANTGPTEYAGEKCSPFFFVTSWQNEEVPSAMGKHMQDKGFNNVYVIAPNYPGGKEHVSGFKREFKGKLADEIYVKLGQLDYSVEIAALRSAKPDAAYIFLPGAMGINFIKQYQQAGLGKTIPIYASAFSADEDIIKAVGEPMLGIFNSSHWAHDLDNAANKRFVADFKKEYGRTPTLYASQGYDAGRMINAALRATGGKIEDKAAFGKALKSGKFDTVRGEIKFNNNNYPIQNYYLRQVVKTDQGVITNKLIATIWNMHADSYAAQCKMK